MQKMSSRTFVPALFTLFIGMLSWHCGSSWDPRLPTLGEKLGQASSDALSVAYVAHFADVASRRDHEQRMQSSGAQVRIIGDEASSTLLRVTASPDVLRRERVPATLEVALDAPVHLIRPSTRDGQSTTQDSGLPESLATQVMWAEDFLTARRVTGAAALEARFPNVHGARGDGVMVAILDTGIDFGLPGVSLAPGKLRGFYDFSGFGRTDVAPASASLQARFSQDSGFQQALGEGVLDEAVVAADYLVSGGVDLNGNGGSEDKFPFVLGTAHNHGDALFVWVDRDQSGTFEAAERLGDFNTTGQFLELSQTTPSRVRPLAVTIESATSVQFHSVPEGHGSSCAVIVAGNGYLNGQLRGMAPEASLLSYTLDASGQDVYSVSELLQTFLHARDKGASVVSVSWGFATGDIAASRFIGETLEQELGQKGVVVAVAAGNEGPGFGSAAPDDYVPRSGFIVGAAITEAQARNVYGWSGWSGEDVIWYSSFGPTRAGREAPDVVSPLMTMVRGERGVDANPFYGFGGTSSATPALAGSVASLIGAVRANTDLPIVPRLIKIAIQNTARPLASSSDAVALARSGAGMIDVNAAYDLYVKLAKEWRDAGADQSRRTPFAYGLTVDAGLAGERQEDGRAEGVVRSRLVRGATVRVGLDALSASLVDPRTFGMPLRVEAQGAFIRSPSVFVLQTSPQPLPLEFDWDKIAAGSVAYGVVLLRRPTDNLVLARIPVALARPDSWSLRPGEGVNVAPVDSPLGPGSVWRRSVTLMDAGVLEFKGTIQISPELAEGGDTLVDGTSALLIAIRARDGHTVFTDRVPEVGPATAVSLATGRLPPGDYEILMNRSFQRFSRVTAARVLGAWSTSPLGLVASSGSGDSVDVVVSASRTTKFSAAQLILNRRVTTAPLQLVGCPIRCEYQGGMNWGEPIFSLQLGFRQDVTDRAMRRLLHMEVSLIFSPGDPQFAPSAAQAPATLYRGWTDVHDAGTPLGDADLALASDGAMVRAWPNIVRWSDAPEKVFIVVATALYEPITLSETQDASEGSALTVTLSPGERKSFRFALPEAIRSSWRSMAGSIQLLDAEGKIVGDIPWHGPDAEL